MVFASRRSAGMTGVMMCSSAASGSLPAQYPRCVVVLAGHLCLAIRTEPWTSAILAAVCQALAEALGKLDCHRHSLLGLICSIAEHNALVAGANILLCFSYVHTTSNVGALLFDGDDDSALVAVETLLSVIISDITDSLAHNLLVVNVTLSRNFTEDHDHARLRTRLTGNLGFRVLFETSV